MDKKASRSKILNMLANGIISQEEAEQLLDVIEKQQETTDSNTSKAFKMLKIYITSDGQEKVNFKIPVEFVKVLKAKRFRLDMLGNKIDIDDLIDMVQQGITGELLSIESPNGDLIKIIVE